MTPNRARMLRNERLVLSTLRKQKRPMTAYQVVSHVQERGIASPITVYRALGRLVRDGLVYRVETMKAFVALPRASTRAVPVFLVCGICGGTSKINSKRLSNDLKEWSGARQFEIRKTSFEVAGRCKACQKEAGSIDVQRNGRAAAQKSLSTLAGCRR